MADYDRNRTNSPGDYGTGYDREYEQGYAGSRDYGGPDYERAGGRYSRGYGSTYNSAAYGGGYSTGDRPRYGPGEEVWVGREANRRGYPATFGERGFESAYGGEGYRPEETFRGGREEWGRARGWQAEGPHVGKGPKGYQRPDARICEDVNELLTRNGAIDATDIEVSSEAGVVTLRGPVPDRWTKRLAEEIAENVSGVKDVSNELRIAAAGESQRLQSEKARELTGKGAT